MPASEPVVDYEYDEKYHVLIKKIHVAIPQILKKGEPGWEDLLPGGKYEPYARAVYLGQGCWENLASISHEKAQEVLMEWGYIPKPKKPLLRLQLGKLLIQF